MQRLQWKRRWWGRPIMKPQPQWKRPKTKLAKEKESTSSLLDSVEEENFYDIVKSKDEEAKRRKEERARKRKERKLKKKQEQRESIKEEEKIEEENAETEEVEEGGIDPSLAAMMGFSGFGGGNKNR